MTVPYRGMPSIYNFSSSAAAFSYSFPPMRSNNNGDGPKRQRRRSGFLTVFFLSFLADYKYISAPSSSLVKRCPPPSRCGSEAQETENFSEGCVFKMQGVVGGVLLPVTPRATERMASSSSSSSSSFFCRIQ